jgi:hypothetical protein
LFTSQSLGIHIRSNPFPVHRLREALRYGPTLSNHGKDIAAQHRSYFDIQLKFLDSEPTKILRPRKVCRGQNEPFIAVFETADGDQRMKTYPRRYALASARRWTLPLSGDGELRALAQAQGVPFFGVLWVLDQLFDRQVMEGVGVIAGLEAIAAHPRCRLPRGENSITARALQEMIDLRYGGGKQALK